MAFFLPGLVAGLRELGTSHFYVNNKTTSSKHL
jgi:hypothetical protein